MIYAVRKLLFGALMFAGLTALIGCTRKGDPPPEPPVNGWDTITSFQGWLVPEAGKMKVTIRHRFNGNALQTGAVPYVTAGGDTITVAEFRYYLGQVSLKRVDGSMLNLNNYQLINAAVAGSTAFTIANVPAGLYTGLSFIIGVDSVSNHSGLQEGALDPAWGMFWTWNTGYIFMRINGNAGNTGKKYSFDLGGDNNVVSIASPLTSWKVKSVSPTVELTMNVEEMFHSPDTVRFAQDGYEVHDPIQPLTGKLAQNMKDMIVVSDILP